MKMWCSVFRSVFHIAYAYIMSHYFRCFSCGCSLTDLNTSQAVVYIHALDCDFEAVIFPLMIIHQKIFCKSKH